MSMMPPSHPHSTPHLHRMSMTRQRVHMVAMHRHVRGMWARRASHSMMSLFHVVTPMPRETPIPRRYSPPASSLSALSALLKNLSELGVVAGALGVVRLDVPLEVVGTGIPVLAFGAEGTDVAWGLVNEAVADHFVFALEAAAAWSSRTAGDAAEVGADFGVDVLVGAVDVRFEIVRKTGERLT